MRTGRPQSQHRAASRGGHRQADASRSSLLRPRSGSGLDREILRGGIVALAVIGGLAYQVIASRHGEPAPAPHTATAQMQPPTATDDLGAQVLREFCRSDVTPRRPGLSAEAARLASAVLLHEAEVVAQAEYLDCLMARNPKRLCRAAERRALLDDLGGFAVPRQDHARALAALQRAGTSGRTRSAEIVAEADARVVRGLDKLMLEGYLGPSDVAAARLPAELAAQVGQRRGTSKPCG